MMFGRSLYDCYRAARDEAVENILKLVGDPSNHSGQHPVMSHWSDSAQCPLEIAQLIPSQAKLRQLGLKGIQNKVGTRNIPLMDDMALL